ncbi:MAG: aminoglycoside phosphotransferase [Patescibacteria group bacterium]|nr:aminoglycoside phosphotransferase [Patescibacteria group bacterium]
MKTPDEIISRAVEKNLHAEIFEKTRIFAGEDNEVYDARLSSGHPVVIRISRKGPEEFRKEEWAMNMCRTIGVPVADILFIQDAEHEGKIISISAQSKIPGDSIERGNTDWRKLDKTVLKRLIVQAGAILSKIHSVPVKGFGRLDANGAGTFATFKEFLNSRIQNREAVLAVAGKFGFDKEVIENAFSAIGEFLKQPIEAVPVLNHCDYVPKHFFFLDDRITGIIDFGAVKGHSPVHDFAIWDYWCSEQFPTKWLMEGYLNKELFDGSFKATLRILKLDLGLYLIKLYDERNYDEEVRDAFSRVQKILAD